MTNTRPEAHDVGCHRTPATCVKKENPPRTRVQEINLGVATDAEAEAEADTDPDAATATTASAEPVASPRRVFVIDSDERRSYEQAKRTQAIERTRELVTLAVKYQLVADVPIGCFLSGGIDSSIVAAGMKAGAGKKQPVLTFSIGFDDPQVEQLVADGLTGPDTAGRPEVAEVDDAQQRLNAGAAGGRLAENRGNDQIDNAEDDAVDDERKDSDPESGLGCGGERGRRRRTSGLHRSPPSFGASIAPASDPKPNSAGDRPIESPDGRRGSLPEVGIFQ